MSVAIERLDLAAPLSGAETPLAFGRLWAREHPDDSGVLAVRTLTRKGKGGWGTTAAEQTVFVRGGRAALARADRRSLDQRANGCCPLCQRIWLEPVIGHRLAPEPEAGLAIEGEFDWEGLTQRVPVHRDAYAYVRACEDCAARLGLLSVADVDTHLKYRWESCWFADYRRHLRRRWHPAYPVFLRVEPLRVDLRRRP